MPMEMMALMVALEKMEMKLMDLEKMKMKLVDLEKTKMMWVVGCHSE